MHPSRQILFRRWCYSYYGQCSWQIGFSPCGYGTSGQPSQLIPPQPVWRQVQPSWLMWSALCGYSDNLFQPLWLQLQPSWLVESAVVAILHRNNCKKNPSRLILGLPSVHILREAFSFVATSCSNPLSHRVAAVGHQSSISQFPLPWLHQSVRSQSNAKQLLMNLCSSSLMILPFSRNGTKLSRY